MDREKGYDLSDDYEGELYDSVQTAVNKARSDGADCICLLSHLGLDGTNSKGSCGDIIMHTEGIDVVFDGHSHDQNMVFLKNKNGEEITRLGAGTKLNSIGFAIVSNTGEVVDVGIIKNPLPKRGILKRFLIKQGIISE